MQLNQLFESTITFIIKGQSYVLNQNPMEPIRLLDEREIKGLKTPDGGFVTYGSNMQSPYIVECMAVNVNKAVSSLLDLTFNENLKNNPDYRFTVIMQGKNNEAEDVKLTFKQCVLKQSPSQLELGQELPATRLSLMAKEKICE